MLARIADRARDGDEVARAELYWRMRPLVRKTVRITSNVGGWDAEDIEQNVWLRVYAGLDRLRSGRALPAWVRTITTREVIRHGTARVRCERSCEESELDEIDTCDPAEEAVWQVCREQLLSSLEDLSPRSKALAELLLDGAERSYREIAACLGVPVGSLGYHKAQLVSELRSSFSATAKAS